MFPKTGFFFRPMLVPTLMALVMLPVLLGLGTWQLERLHWKETLIATVEQRAQAEPMSLPPASDWASLDMGELEYRPVKLEGQFRPGIEFHYFTQDEEGVAGYAVIAPFNLASGGTVLVDRGFVLLKFKEPATRALGQSFEPVTIIAILRSPQPRGYFDGEDEIKKNIWFVRDPGKMAASAELNEVAPFLANLQSPTPEGGYPQPRAATVQLRNPHLQYAITWYGMALVFLPIYLIYHSNNGRLGLRRH
jgi:surfeit locus 1 family protein